MRLIHSKTLAVEDFMDEDVPEYAILSHLWATEEMTFQDMQASLRPTHKRGWNKVKRACEQALKDGLTYVWADTCCIDKTSSAELQEALNSMFRYYAHAVKCYVYLADVEISRLTDTQIHAESWEPGATDRQLQHWRSIFKGSKWFTRGWTLQELIAPRHVEFFNNAWSLIGTKDLLAETIADETRIDLAVLKDRVSVSELSVAKRMSWAARRQTSRAEDRAYSLLGLFDINMPMLYGEGAKAFTRLQEEIIKISPDHSIFAWKRSSDRTQPGTLLAESPADFLNLDDVVLWGKPPSFEMTNRGLRIELPLLGPCDYEEHEEFYAVLGCCRESNIAETFALRLGKQPRKEEYFVACSAHSVFPERVFGRETTDRDPRVILIDRRHTTGAVMSSLLIPRHLRMESNDPYFLVNMYSEARDSVIDLKIIDVFPKARWSAWNVVVRPPFGRRVRGGVALRATSGVVVLVAFGYDYLPGDHGKATMVPGVWSERGRDGLSLSDWCYAQGSCSHANCLGRCATMSDSATWHNYSISAAPLIEISASIWTEHFMEEDILNVSVVQRVFFKHSNPSELDAINTEMRPNPPGNFSADPVNVTNARSLQTLSGYFAQIPSLSMPGLATGPSASDLSLLFKQAMPLLVFVRYTGSGQLAIPPDIIDWFPRGHHRHYLDHQILEANEKVCAGFQFRSSCGSVFTLVVYGNYRPWAPSGVLLWENLDGRSLASIVTYIERCEDGEGLCGYPQHDSSLLNYRMARATPNCDNGHRLTAMLRRKSVGGVMVLVVDLVHTVEVTDTASGCLRSWFWEGSMWSGIGGLRG